MPGAPDPELRDYLQRVVGRHGATSVTIATRYASWADLFAGVEGPPQLDPMPEGACVLIGMRDMVLGLPGPEAFLAFSDDDPTVLAARLAERLIKARTSGGGPIV